MKIKMTGIELEAWAKGRWKTAVEQITDHHHGDLLKPLAGIDDAEEFARRLHNNTQIIQRAFRNETPNYRRHAAALIPAIRAAIDADEAEKTDQQSLVATANRECIEATSAVLTGKPLAIIQREAIEAIAALAAVAGVRVQITPAAWQAA